MRMRLYRGLVGRTLVGLACLAPAGCAERLGSATPAESLALMRTGRPVLNCREACLAEWQRAQPQAAQLDAGERWEELALLVMRIGYQDDLSLYYLGRAAEGMRYRAAAASYYRQSIQLSGTSISCRYLSRQCGGVTLPSTASLRLAAVERIVNPPEPRWTGPAPRTPKTSFGKAEAPAPGPVSGPAPIPAASPASSPVSSPVPSPVPSPVSSPGGAGAAEFIEPPAAAH
jgi:hypothetical protein